MLIKNVNVFRLDGQFRTGDVSFSDIIRHVGRIDGAADIDAEGGYLIPGLIDIHTHGAIGCDASDGDAAGLETMARYYAAHGVTSFGATTMTLSEATLAPARELRMAHMFGSIEQDKAADMLILGRDLKLKYTIIGGEVIQ